MSEFVCSFAVLASVKCGTYDGVMKGTFKH